MTVSGLENYVARKIPNATYETNLKDFIQLQGHKKTVLLDASSVAPTVCKKLQNLAYFQPKPFKDGIHKYIQNILSTGTKVVLVLGYFIDNYSRFFMYQQIILQNIIESLESLKEGNDENFKKLDKIFKKYDKCAINTLLKIQHNNYEILKSKEVSQKIIIDYIKRNNCSSVVIANNSNFLIYTENFLYVKADYIDFETLDCTVYDKDKILKYFDLNSDELPLFATLCGNEVIERRLLQPFHKKITTYNLQLKSDHIYSVALYIKKDRNLEKNLQRLVKEINCKRIDKKLLMDSINMYKCNETNFSRPINSDTEESYDLLENKKLNFETNIYRIICYNIFKIECCLENPLDSSIISCVDLFKSLRQKLYGILLYDSDHQNVEEYYLKFLNAEKKKNPDKVAAIPPTSYHPGLRSLWTKEGDDANKVKWELMLNTVSPNLDLSHMKHIPSTFLIPVLALRYLYTEIPKITGQKYFTSDFEMEAFLIVALLIRSKNESFFENTYEKPDYRAVDLSTKYTKCCDLMCLLNEACGFVIPKDETCLCNYFDDIIFQKTYKKLKDRELQTFIANNDSLNDLITLIR